MKPELSDLLIHPKTKLMLNSFLTSPSHALLITGDVGSGKRTIAMVVASRLLDVAPSALDSYPYFIHIQKLPSEKEISIAAVRELIKNLQLKTLGGADIRRVVFIEDAGNMSIEAQNSLLKMFEEPSPDTVFIATTFSEKSILPTIASRAQVIHINQVSLNDAQIYYSADESHDAISRAWQLSRGNVGLLTALLNDNESHSLKEAVETAKNLIRQDPYERLLTLDSLSKDKANLVLLLDALNRVITSLHHNAVRAGNLGQQKSLLRCRHLINDLQSDLEVNANPRLAVMHLAVNLSV